MAAGTVVWTGWGLAAWRSAGSCSRRAECRLRTRVTCGPHARRWMRTIAARPLRCPQLLQGKVKGQRKGQNQRSKHHKTNSQSEVEEARFILFLLQYSPFKHLKGQPQTLCDKGSTNDGKYNISNSSHRRLERASSHLSALH